MRYPVMTERHLADRWQVSLKTLRRWRLDNEGPVWHKLFRHVRYHEADIIDFERRSAQHLMTLLGISREFKPSDAEVGEELDAEGNHYLTAKEMADAASLPIHLFRDQAERSRKRVPHLMLVGKPQLRQRDIVFNNTNTKELVGKCALWSSEEEPVFSNHMTRIRVSEESCDPAYLRFAILHHWMTGKSEMLARSHVAQASIIGARFREIEVPWRPRCDHRPHIAGRRHVQDLRYAGRAGLPGQVFDWNALIEEFAPDSIGAELLEVEA